MLIFAFYAMLKQFTYYAHSKVLYVSSPPIMLKHRVATRK